MTLSHVSLFLVGRFYYWKKDYTAALRFKSHVDNGPNIRIDGRFPIRLSWNVG
jgi:hypothetical protein